MRDNTAPLESVGAEQFNIERVPPSDETRNTASDQDRTITNQLEDGIYRSRNGQSINQGLIRFLANEVQTAAYAEKPAEQYLTDLFAVTNELLLVLEGEEGISDMPRLPKEARPPKEAPITPPYLPPLPSVVSLLRLEGSEQERILDKRASDLIREIEGLRLGYYKAPEFRLDYRMIEQARRRYLKLRDTAMRLGHWTEGRWEVGSEETHFV